MEKSKLIGRLKDARNTEESIISVSAEHIQALTLRSDLSKENKEKAKSFIKDMIDASNRHKKIVERLIADIQSEGKNDY